MVTFRPVIITGWKGTEFDPVETVTIANNNFNRFSVEKKCYDVCGFIKNYVE